MKKILIILIAILIFTSCVHAQDNTTVEINGVIFEIPEKYQGGHTYKNGYSADYFHLTCIDENIAKSIGSGNSIYEISWLGNNITPDIEKLIKDTPPSKINEDKFYSILDESIKTYKIIKSQQDEWDAEYNYLEAKYHDSLSKNPEDRRTKELLITLLNS